jgi:hypothetical protein
MKHIHTCVGCIIPSISRTDKVPPRKTIIPGVFVFGGSLIFSQVAIGIDFDTIHVSARFIIFITPDYFLPRLETRGKRGEISAGRPDCIAIHGASIERYDMSVA